MKKHRASLIPLTIPEQKKSTLEYIPQFSAYLIILSLVYSVLKLHILFQVFLEIPIFQLIEASELILFAPSNLIENIILFTGVLYSSGIITDPTSHHNKFFVGLATIMICMLYYQYMAPIHSYANSGSLGILAISTCFRFVIPFFTLVFIYSSRLRKVNLLILPILFIIYEAHVESFLHYNFDIKGDTVIPAKIKLNDSTVIRSTKTFKLIDRTNNFWFFYDVKKRTTRIIRDSDVQVSEFITITDMEIKRALKERDIELGVL